MNAVAGLAGAALYVMHLRRPPKKLNGFNKNTLVLGIVLNCTAVVLLRIK